MRENVKHFENRFKFMYIYIYMYVILLFYQSNSLLDIYSGFSIFLLKFMIIWLFACQNFR